MAIVQTRALTKIFRQGQVGAVVGVDLESREGEFLVLLGPSGSGKTTLLRMIAGLEEPTSGEILIGGKIVNDLTPRERRIAMVFQSYALYPHLTVLGNIVFPLKAQRVPAAERREEGAVGGRPSRDRPTARSTTPGAVGRRAPARRARPRHRPRADRLPPRRAPLEPGREAPRLGPRGARTVPAPCRRRR